MNFTTLKSKFQSTEHNANEIHLATLSETSGDDYHVSNIDKLRNEIEYKEVTLNIFVKHLLTTLDANIDDIKILIDQKRTEYKIFKLPICDLWLRLKKIEHMAPYTLVTFLRTSQLHRPEIKLSEVNTDFMETEQQYLTNPRRTRLSHFHICTGSDEFDINITSYVGLLVFSYDNQSKFILNRHHCQRGDIVIKQMKMFNHPQILHRGIYDALFKWYFDRAIDEKFFGVGFLYSHGRWRYDLIASDDRGLLPYEYRILDMFLFTHWLTQSSIPHNTREMEIDVKDGLSKQYDVVDRKLRDQERSDLLNVWNEFIGSDAKDLQVAIEQFLQTIAKEIQFIFKEIDIRNKNIFPQLVPQIM